MKRGLSDSTIYIAIGFLILVFIAGPTKFIVRKIIYSSGSNVNKLYKDELVDRSYWQKRFSGGLDDFSSLPLL